MLKEITTGLVVTVISGTTALGDINIPSTGVWSGGPRAYVGSSLADIPLDLNNPYTFKLELENTGDLTEQVNLTGKVIGLGLGNIFYDSSFDLSPRNSTIRGGKFGEFPSQGDYDVVFDWSYSGNKLSSSKKFNVVPEPASLLLWMLPAYQLLRRKRR